MVVKLGDLGMVDGSSTTWFTLSALFVRCFWLCVTGWWSFYLCFPSYLGCQELTGVSIQW
jgi:hypothetical protein